MRNFPLTPKQLTRMQDACRRLVDYYSYLRDAADSMQSAMSTAYDGQRWMHLFNYHYYKDRADEVLNEE